MKTARCPEDAAYIEKMIVILPWVVLVQPKSLLKPSCLAGIDCKHLTISSIALKYKFRFLLVLDLFLANVAVLTSSIVNFLFQWISAQNTKKVKDNEKEFNILSNKSFSCCFSSMTSSSSKSIFFLSCIRQTIHFLGTNGIKSDEKKRESKEEKKKGQRRDWWSPMYFDETLTRFLPAFFVLLLDVHLDRVFRILSFIFLSQETSMSSSSRLSESLRANERHGAPYRRPSSGARKASTKRGISFCDKQQQWIAIIFGELVLIFKYFLIHKELNA